MPLHEFWYEEERLFECYVKAYRNRVNEVAWLHGLYIYDAVSCAVNNVIPLAVNKGVTGKGNWKPLEYHMKPINLFLNTESKIIAESKSANELSGVAAWSERIKKLKNMEA